jgi:hypothetical protein
MTTTRKDLITSASRRLGGRTGTVLSGNGTTLVLGGLVGTTGDDSRYQYDLLFLLDADVETDRERMINLWVDLTGTATVAVRSESSPANESYILVDRADYTLAEYRAALNLALTKTERSYRSVIPLNPAQRVYPLNDLTWLQGAKDVDQAVWSRSPNALHNEEFALWQSYTVPDGWTVDGEASRVSGFGVGGYACRITNDDGAAQLSQSMPAALTQWLARIATARETVRAAAWVTCGAGTSARVGVSNGTTTAWSDYHTGSGIPEYLDASVVSAATDSDYEIIVESAEDVTTTVQRAALYYGTSVDDTLKDYGSQGYVTTTIEPQAIRNVGGVPIVELPEGWIVGPGQLVVTSRRPFSEMTADSDAIDDQYARALEAGLLRWMLDASKKGQDRTRLDRVMVDEARIWTDLTAGFQDHPVEAPTVRWEVVGA